MRFVICRKAEVLISLHDLDVGSFLMHNCSFFIYSRMFEHERHMDSQLRWVRRMLEICHYFLIRYGKNVDKSLYSLMTDI